MKKKLVKGLVICGMIGISFTALGTNVEAATYYGNGVYCNKQKCWVDWSRARSEIIDRGVKAYVNGFTKVLGGIGGR
ncbi:enterocin [Enterococcus faecalis]|nr:enterocin [Enterococcus faecalis]EGO5077205.1 enterocin [Enterococcus faecalis]